MTNQSISNFILKKYSDKSIVLVGETKPYKESIKLLGGKWNSNLKSETDESFSGWIFPSTKECSVRGWLDQGCPDLTSNDQKSHSATSIHSSVQNLDDLRNELLLLRSEIDQLKTLYSELKTKLG